MIRKNQNLLNATNMLLDGILIFASYLAATYIRFDLLYGHTPALELGWDRPLLLVAGLYSVVIVLSFYAFKLYGSYRFQSQSRELTAICSINAMGVFVVTGILYITKVTDFSRLAIFLFFVLSIASVSLKRICLRTLLRHLRKRGYNQKHVIVVGNGHFARQYIEDVKKAPHLGFVVDGYVGRMEDPGMDRRLGGYEELGPVLERYNADELIVALEPQEACLMAHVLACAEKEGIKVSVVPFYNDYLPAHTIVDAVGRTKLIVIRVIPLDNLIWQLVKRAMDVAGSLAILLLASPLMAVTAIGVRLSSPGPVIFRQERVGKNKKPFCMYKFRSMQRNSAENTGWSTDADPRRTRFGSFIRKYSIDELPQLFNVLKGDMSLVGPRPEIPFYVRQFKEEVPLYLVRQQVRPGMTGWAQVHGLRGDTSIEKRVEYDIWYIENWSLWLDIKILFMTAFGGMRNSERAA